MARRKHSQPLEDDEPALDISSLIDVCFLLLIYFIVTNTIQPQEKDLGLTLPSAAPSETPPVIEPMLIHVAQNGSITINKNEALDTAAVVTVNTRSLPQLEQRLGIYKNGASAANTEPLVQISVDGEAPQQAVVDVLNTLVGLHINKVTFTDFANN